MTDPTLEGWEAPPTGVEERVRVSQRQGVGPGPNGFTHDLGGWDWRCTLCPVGTGWLPFDRDEAVRQAHAHLAEKHP